MAWNGRAVKVPSPSAGCLEALQRLPDSAPCSGAVRRTWATCALKSEEAQNVDPHEQRHRHGPHRHDNALRRAVEQGSRLLHRGDGPAAAGSAVEGAFRRLGQALAQQGMEVLHERVFGSLDACPMVLQARKAALLACGRESETPATYVEGRPTWGDGFAGASVMAVRPGEAGSLATVRDAAGRACGRTWKTHGGDVHLPPVPPRRCERQTRRRQPGRPGRQDVRRGRATAGEPGHRLPQRGPHLAYVSDILAWYGELNRVRSGKDEGFGLMPKPGARGTGAILLPASTGIEGNAPTGAAVQPWTCWPPS